MATDDTARDESSKPRLEVVSPTPEDLDEEEKEFRALRRDLPGVKGASAAGIVAISVGKAPGKNEFFRCHPGRVSVGIHAGCLPRYTPPSHGGIGGNSDL